MPRTGSPSIVIAGLTRNPCTACLIAGWMPDRVRHDNVRAEGLA
jgi:hypothetical protein